MAGNVVELTRPGDYLEVTVVITRRFRFRVWIGMALIRFACWVSTIGLKVEEQR